MVYAAYVAFPLTHSKNRLFPNAAVPSMELFISVLILLFPANEGFVYFHYFLK